MDSCIIAIRLHYCKGGKAEGQGNVKERRVVAFPVSKTFGQETTSLCVSTKDNDIFFARMNRSMRANDSAEMRRRLPISWMTATQTCPTFSVDQTAWKVCQRLSIHETSDDDETTPHIPVCSDHFLEEVSLGIMCSSLVWRICFGLSAELAFLTCG